MSDIAICAENLSKLYHIGRSQQRHDTLRDALMSLRPQRSRNGTGSLQGVSNPSRDDTDLWALRDVSFEVKQGEVIGIFGRNGAGKSTLLKILSRITEPAAGRVALHGRVASLLEVGTGFHPELTGRDNIYLNGAILGMRRTEIARKFDEIVAFAEIERFLDTPVKRYSSGMYVRLAFAVAAYLEPEILLVDEVLAVGDAAFQKKCLGKMGNVAKEGRTVLFVSHNMVAVQTLCQRGLWLDNGRVKLEGPIEQVLPGYLRSGLTESSSNERTWADDDTAPGNATVRLCRIKVAPETEEFAGEVITMQTPLRIEVEYHNILAATHLHVTLHVRNDQGIIAFSASSGFDPDPVLHMKPPVGLLTSVCHIPANLLNSGFHRVDLLLVRDTAATTFVLEDAIGFEVANTAERKFAWFGREPGAVQPLLDWETVSRIPLDGRP